MRTRSLWVLHLLTLVGVVLWAMFDLRFEAMFGALRSMLSTPDTSMPAVAEAVGMVRVAGIGVLVLVAVVTLAGILGRLFRSDQNARSRSIASLLAITTVVALWLSVGVNHTSLAWQGKRVRMAVEVERLETLTASLRQQWPERDGELPGVGPFMAYPFGRPTTLVLLQAPAVSGEQLCIAAIERQRDGAILLQLSGGGYDDWAEWHPEGSQPASFVGGLSDPHELKTATSLGNGWHLVRYAPVSLTTPLLLRRI